MLNLTSIPDDIGRISFNLIIYHLNITKNGKMTYYYE